MKEIDYECQLEIISEKIKKELAIHFIKADQLHTQKTEKVLCDFGYKLEEKIVKLKQIDADLPHLVWGFKKDEFKMFFNSSFSEIFLVADRKSMDKIVRQSIIESDSYVHSVISKLKLLNVTHFLENDDIFNPGFDDDCISKTKKNSVSFIYEILHIKGCVEDGYV